VSINHYQLRGERGSQQSRTNTKKRRAEDERKRGMEEKKRRYQAQVFFCMSATLLGSIIHFYDNYVNLHLYAMGPWINQNAWIIPAYWLVMTLISLLAWRDAAFNGPKTLLFVYAGMAMFSYGHYATRPFWEWSWAQNLFILAETVPATILAIVVWLH